VCDDPSEVRTLALHEYTKEQAYGIHGLVHYEINQLRPQTRISNTDGNAYRPDVAFDAINKRFLVVWEEEKFNKDQWGNVIGFKLPKIYGRLITSSSYYTEPFIISFTDNNRDSQNDPEVENSRQTHPSVAYDDVNKRFFVIWQDSRNGSVSFDNMDVYGQYVNPEGSLSGSNYVISTNPHNQLTPVVGYSNNANEYIAIWKDARRARQPGGSDIYAQRFTLGQPQLAIIDPSTGLAIHPTVINFGSQSLNSIAVKGLKFRNVGDMKLRITDMTSINSPFRYENPPLALVDNNPNTFIELDPGAELDITVSFRPTAVNSYGAEFTIYTNGGERRVALYGLGVSASIGVEEGDDNRDGVLNFSDVRVGQTNERWFRLINDSSMTYRITSIVLPAGEPFSIVWPTLNFPIQMASGAGVDIYVRFSPTSRGNFGGTIRINTDDPSIGSVNLTINGRGIAPVLTLLGSNRVDFGQVRINTTSSKTVTVKNDGDAPMKITSCGSDQSGAFRVSSCPSGNINPGDTANITYEFSPTEIKSYTATIDIQSDGGSVQLNLSGSGVGGKLEVQPSIVDFGRVEVNRSSDRNITLRNTGNFTLTIQSISFSNNVFSVQDVNLPIQIPPGGFVSIKVRFTPTSQTSYSGVMTISSDGINSSVSVNLSGSGITLGGGSGNGGGSGSGNQGGGQPIITSNQGAGGCSMGGGAKPLNAIVYVIIGVLPLLRKLLRKVF
ncbi:MAG: choice-of-anchor D domain-containing protein, partial [Aquificaceae bacterium]|nr:choice-of-anchor D domain-containing protein [Aquificaceae bacterium]